MFQKLWPRLKLLEKVGQRSSSQGPKFWYQWKGHFGGNIYAKYESPSSQASEVLAKIKPFKKQVKGQRHRVNYFGFSWKLLSEGVHM